MGLVDSGSFKIGATVKRFILPILCSLVIYLLAVLNPDQFNCYSIVYCCSLLFLVLRVYAESNQWSEIRYYITSILLFLPVGWCLYTTPLISYTAGFLTLGLLILLFIAPFIKKEANELAIWQFQYKLFTRILFSITVVIILIAITAFIHHSLDELFDLVLLNIFKDTLLFITIVFFPIMVMSGIPARYDNNASSNNYPGFVYLALNYFIIPFLLVYSAILHLYSLRILVTLNLPRGQVAYLVVSFATVGILAYLMSYPFFRENKVLLFVKKHFFKILMVPILLLSLAIGIRIHEYGITESRYIVLLLLVWFITSIGFSFFLQEAKLSKYIIVCIASLLIIASTPGIGAIKISELSQNSRLENILLESGILVNGKITKPSHQPSIEQIKEIKHIVEYLVRTKKVNKLHEWFKNINDAQINQNPPNFSSKQILLDMGISYE